jgi:hypothetical protein
VLRGWIGRYGVPRALYTDWKNVYKRQPTTSELLRGKAATTQFGRMCERLEIRIIAASSPQAKGRVERNNGVHQDRLVKKLRRQGIQSYEVTNAYLEAEYLPEHNQRFAREAARSENYHVKTPSAAKLREVFRLETERWISKDWVVQYRGHFLQLKPQNRRYGPTKAKALICEWEDGAVEVHYRGECLDYEDLVVRPRAVQAAISKPRREPTRRVVGRGAQDHPWWQGYEQRMKRQKLKQSAPLRCPPPLRPKRAAQTAAQGFAPADTSTTTANQKKRDTSNEVRKGTFLKRLDTNCFSSLTCLLCST